MLNHKHLRARLSLSVPVRPPLSTPKPLRNRSGEFDGAASLSPAATPLRARTRPPPLDKTQLKRAALASSDPQQGQCRFGDRAESGPYDAGRVAAFSRLHGGQSS